MLEVVFLGSVHGILGELRLPCGIAGGDGLVGECEVGLLYAGAVVVEGVFSLELQPRGEREVEGIVAEGTPALVAVL